MPVQGSGEDSNLIPGRPTTTTTKKTHPGVTHPAATAPAPTKPKPTTTSSGPTSQASNRKIGSYTSWTGDPAKGAVPAGEYNVLESLMGEWESLVGYSVEPTNAQLLAMANA